MTFSHARRPRRSAGFPVCAAILLVTCLVSSVRAGEILLEQTLAEARFSQRTSKDERKPVAAFATQNGVYELDATKGAVRVWPRSFLKDELEASRLNGVDSAKAGARFSSPVSMRKKPGENVIAVVDACSTIEGLGQYSRIAFYSFVETLSDGVLSAVTFTYEGEIRNVALANASDVAFFPAGDKVAVSISRFSSGPSSDDEGAVQFYEVPTSADELVTNAVNSFLCVRTKNVYEGSSHYNSVGAEAYNVPATGVFVDPDGERIYVGTKNLSAVLRYDPVSPGSPVYDEEITVRTWEYNWIDGYRWVTTTFSGATADFVQGATGDTGIFAVPTGFSAGDLGMAGSTNNLLSMPGSIQLWESPNGNLLVVADTDNDRVVAFDEMGNARFTFNPTDRYDSKFSRPEGAWVSDDGTELVVSDTGNGRVEIFKLAETDSAPDETVGAEVSAAWYCESDAQVFTNWLVAAAASLTNRSYSIEVSVSPAGSASVEPAVVELPAGADRAPFFLKPLDGVAGGSTGTLTVAGQSFDFIVTNAAPTVRTGPRTNAAVDDQSWMYADEGLLNDPLEFMDGMFAPESFRLLVAREGSGGIHLHAKAFDVAADSELTYEWRIVGTTNVLLLEAVAGTSLETLDPAPIYPWKPVWYYEYEEGVPATVKTNFFTKTEVESFPRDNEGNYLYIEVHESQQIANETWSVTNVLQAGEIQSAPLMDMQMIDWPPVLFDDEQNARFLVSDTTLTGADATFADAQDGVLYFAILTVTDKDGGVWNSLETSSGSFFAFATGPALPPPPVDGALYAAVFTDVSGTNVAFRIQLASGNPADTDRAELQYVPSLPADTNAWTALFEFSPGSLILTPIAFTNQPAAFQTGEPVLQTVDSGANGIHMEFIYENEPADSARFYRIYQTQP